MVGKRLGVRAALSAKSPYRMSRHFRKQIDEDAKLAYVIAYLS